MWHQLLLVLSLYLVYVQTYELKRLAGPPEEFSLRRVPLPEHVATEHYAVTNNGASTSRLYVAPSTLAHHVGSTIGLDYVLFDAMSDSAPTRSKRRPHLASILPVQRVTSSVYGPDSQEIQVTTNGGRLEFVPPTEGVYVIDLRVYHSNINETITHNARELVMVIDGSLQLTGRAHASYQSGRIFFSLEVNQAVSVERELVLYAEVWAATHEPQQTRTNLTTLLPVCWVSGIVLDSTNDDIEGLYLGPPLEIDERWLTLVGTRPPLRLRHIRLTDRNVLLSELQEVELYLNPVSHVTLSAAIPLRMVEHVLPLEMYYGLPPASTLHEEHPKQYRKNATPESSEKQLHNRDTKMVNGLLLVHGYCALSNPFEPIIEAFGPDTMLFLVVDESMTNDYFARSILNYTLEQGLESFSIIAHSQGGLAALHLHNYYWSGLERAIDGRLIQSIGSPYRGTKLAGWWATLGNIFGIGCGACYDLSHAGATFWLSGISSKAISDVYYYTTQEGSNGQQKTYCNGLTNSILDSPNDGIAELAYSLLDGATHVLHDIGQCHSVDMNWPAQCLDRDRAVEMSSLGAR